MISRCFLILVPLLACGEPATGPVEDDDEPRPTPTYNHSFTYSPPPGAPPISTITVRGEFNDWGESTMGRQSDGSYRHSLNLDDGDQPYKFFINGDWIIDMCHDEVWGDPDAGQVVDPDADGCVDDGNGGRNAVVTIGEVPVSVDHSPGDPAELSVAGGRLSVRFRVRAEGVEEAAVVSSTDSVSAHRQLATGLEEVWRASLPTDVTEYEVVVATADSTVRLGPFEVPAEPFASVAWVEDAVGYQIFPERFWNGDPTNDSLGPATDEYHHRHPETGGTVPHLTDSWSGPVGPSHCCHQYFGGDLQGVIDRLDELVDLGVNVLYLNPIFSAGSAHGYDTFDYMEVAPNFGDSTVLRSLVDAADARGMRIIWDYVPNHVGIGHWAFRDAVEKGEASDYWSWFDFYVPADSIQAGNGNHYEAWWGFGSLPELQTQQPAVMDHLLDVVRGWTEFGLHGIRVDVPNEIENRSVFYPAFREAAKSLDPEVYLVGEIWELDPSWLRGDQFDALMNYAMGEGVVERFAAGELSAAGALRDMAGIHAAYPEAATAMMFNLVASHDTDRLLTKLGGGELGGTPPPESLERQRLASALLFALPGMPVTFQGDECAFLGGRDGEHTARYPVQWDECDADMRSHYALLADLKRGTPALGSPALRLSYDAGPLLAFYRGEPGPGEVLAVFNNEAEAASLELPAGSWTDLATGEAVAGPVDVEGLGWRYLRRD